MSLKTMKSISCLSLLLNFNFVLLFIVHTRFKYLINVAPFSSYEILSVGEK